MRRAVLLSALVAAAACNNKPTGFGVDVEARTQMLASSLKSQIVSARLIVSGAETFVRTVPNVAKAVQSGAMKFRYVPGVHAGSITVRVDGLGADGSTLAAGIAPPVTLVDGKAVDAVLTLATNGNGVPCTAPTDCISGNCVDGVCCESLCDGVCETCNDPATPGVCSPIMMGSDPDGECAAKLPPVDGGTDNDGGTGTGSTSGTGVMITPEACGGTCSGNRSCMFPGADTSCGTSFCPATGTVGSFACDGNGSCNEVDSQCTHYTCDSPTGACKTMCNSNADCLDTDFCNLNINQCVPKRDLGTMCANTFECKSGYCASGVCCDTACTDSGQSCNNMGNVGHCQCTGVTCPAGVSCTLFYKDGDGDGYGDQNGTIGNGTAKAGCVGDTPPTGFVTNNKDCDDGDGQANPSQTGYFGYKSSSNTGTYDWNCDGVLEKGTPELASGSTCGFCTGIPICGKSSTCMTANTGSVFSCGYKYFCSLITSAFLTTVGCGGTGTLYTCTPCTFNGGTAGMNTTPSYQQTCH